MIDDEDFKKIEKANGANDTSERSKAKRREQVEIVADTFTKWNPAGAFRRHVRKMWEAENQRRILIKARRRYRPVFSQ